ncbi:hypothetical protein FACS1894214_4490 [Planctomycetales bacterium]|nr:hypothetical protein FACS1894214_4490 [Planctomycetales bacterium]
MKLKDAVAAKAKERQGKRNDLKENNIPQNSAECKETRQELAKIAEVSHDTLNRVEYLVQHADEETKAKTAVLVIRLSMLNTSGCESRQDEKNGNGKSKPMFLFRSMSVSDLSVRPLLTQ